MMRFLRKILGWPTKFVPTSWLVKAIYYQIYTIASANSANKSLSFLLDLEQRLMFFTGDEAVRYGKGVHPKHRHVGYHDFFCDRVSTNDNILDVGCGVGSLAFSLSKKGKHVIGVEIRQEAVDEARARFAAENLEFMCADATQLELDVDVDRVVMSNVLEHVEDRVGLLTSLQHKYQPQSFLIRVPMSDRDWRVPLMDELGVDSRLDYTHFIEYTRTSLLNELESAGLEVSEWIVNWGESWVVATSPVAKSV